MFVLEDDVNVFVKVGFLDMDLGGVELVDYGFCWVVVGVVVIYIDECVLWICCVDKFVVC